MAVDFIAGLNGGLAGLVVVHPMDTIKVRLQMQNSAATKYRGSFHCFVSIVKEESFWSIYKGMASPALTTSTLNAMIFGVYGRCIRRLDSSKLSHHFLAGTAAGLVQSPFCCVVELSKVRIQTQGIGERADRAIAKRYSGSINAIFSIMKTEGVWGWSRGLTMVTIRDVPGFGVYFLSYEGLCRLIGKYYSSADLPFVPLMVAGGTTGVLSWMSVYSVDVIKTRYQADGIDGNRKYSSYLDVVRDIRLQNGIRGFHAGLGVTLFRAFPANAVIFGVVHLTHRLLG